MNKSIIVLLLTCFQYIEAQVIIDVAGRANYQEDKESVWLAKDYGECTDCGVKLIFNNENSLVKLFKNLIQKKTKLTADDRIKVPDLLCKKDSCFAISYYPLNNGTGNIFDQLGVLNLKDGSKELFIRNNESLWTDNLKAKNKNEISFNSSYSFVIETILGHFKTEGWLPIYTEDFKSHSSLEIQRIGKWDIINYEKKKLIDGIEVKKGNYFNKGKKEFQFGECPLGKVWITDFDKIKIIKYKQTYLLGDEHGEQCAFINKFILVKA